MKTKIKGMLNEIAIAKGVHILFACESGSRGWGCPSIDSDYDVRFIYTRRAEDYASVFPLDMELRFPIVEEIDLKGWDLTKVLALLYKSNVSPFEWLQSPVVYHEAVGFKTGFLTLLEKYYSPRGQAHHYLGIVRSKLGDLEGETIALKSLFYIIRSLLAAEWCIMHGSYAPMELVKLLVVMPNAIRSDVMHLLSLKSRVDESFTYSCPTMVKSYVQKRFSFLENEVHELPLTKLYKEELEDYFQTMVK